MSSGFSLSGRVRDTTEVEILLAIVASLKDQIPAFSNNSTCFVSDVPWPDVTINENLFCTVAPGDASYDPHNIDGGGNLQVTEAGQMIVSIWSRIETDQLDRFISGLTDSGRGLLVLKQAVLKALAGKNLDGGDETILLQTAMTPSRCHREPQKPDDFAGVSLGFDVVYNWNLGTAPEFL